MWDLWLIPDGLKVLYYSLMCAWDFLFNGWVSAHCPGYLNTKHSITCSHSLGHDSTLLRPSDAQSLRPVILLPPNMALRMISTALLATKLELASPRPHVESPGVSLVGRQSGACSTCIVCNSHHLLPSHILRSMLGSQHEAFGMEYTAASPASGNLPDV